MGSKKDTLKIFREKNRVKISSELLNLRKNQLELRSKINNTLKSGPVTVPEIANKTGLEPNIVFWYLMTDYKHNLIEVVEKTGEGYYKYGLKAKG